MKRPNKEQQQALFESLKSAREGNLPWLDKLIRKAGYKDVEKLTRTEVAGICMVSTPTVSKWIEDGLDVRGSKVSLEAVAKYLSNKVKRVTQEKTVKVDQSVKAEFDNLMKDTCLEDIPDTEDPYLDNGNSFYRELGYKRMAQKLKIENEVKRNRLVEKSEMLTRWREILANWRKVVETSSTVLCESCKRKFTLIYNDEVERISTPELEADHEQD
jgi:transcriptional regulator with XRE-family HTH domain